MFKLIVLAALAALVWSQDEITPYNDLIVQTEGGLVQGTEERIGLLGDRYFSWKGIPYAEPPVGNLRFREVGPHPGWSGVRDASEHGESCPSGGFLTDKAGDEDCLFLNVYTTSMINRKPVMVWIHGGSFTGGSGDTFMYGPDHLVTEDVVIVTINYRLGVLGFLSTGDQHAPGNYGMRDMITALRWVQNNILAFGGDPDNVTIFGESAGGVAVHYLLLSPMSQGLFHKAISQSGSVLSPWAFQPDPMAPARDLAEALGITFTSTQDLVNQLRNRPAADFVINTPGWLDLPIPRGLSAMPFVPCIDGAGSDQTVFLPRHPKDMMESGDFLDIPVIFGYTSDESLFMVREQLLDAGVVDIINANRNFVVPTTLWGIDRNSAAGQTITTEMWNYYLNNQDLDADNRYNWTQYNTDHHFIYGVDTSIRLHLQYKSSPVYYYVFSFDGDLNLVKRLLLLTAYPGAVHADEIPYMFSVSRFPTIILPSNHANVVRRRLVRMWSAFATGGNPTPVIDSVITTNWPRVGSNQEFMDIGHDLVAGTHPMGTRMALWNDLKNRFVNNK